MLSVVPGPWCVINVSCSHCYYYNEPFLYFQMSQSQCVKIHVCRLERPLGSHSELVGDYFSYCPYKFSYLGHEFRAFPKASSFSVIKIKFTVIDFLKI